LGHNFLHRWQSTIERIKGIAQKRKEERRKQKENAKNDQNYSLLTRIMAANGGMDNGNGEDSLEDVRKIWEIFFAFILNF
jgi:hypothetical protein